ncbi:hypothetical protein VTJ83DRAFT_4156 [Remersonia thermophila]|uniref:Uncharacterized protein n=1 Tax=Remersonia thermophila TaxID=72144 RepID=A0ABR4DB83_9PEZI
MELPRPVINTALAVSRGLAGTGALPPASVRGMIGNTGNPPSSNTENQIVMGIDASPPASDKDNTGAILKQIGVEIPPDVREAADNAAKHAREKAAEGVDWAKENPCAAALAAVAVGGLAAVAAPAIITAPLLAIAGFGPGGPVAGGLAAAVQSSIGNVAAGSLFATLQSAAMGGYGAAQVAAAVQGAGACIGALAGIGAARAAQEKEENKEEK